MYSPSSFRNELPEEFAIYDLETTGVDTQVCEITEIGIAIVKGGRIAEQKAMLVRTKHPVPEEVEKLTGITNALLEADGIPLETALRDFLGMLGKRRLVGHNILRYDNPILRRMFWDSLDADLDISGVVDTAGLFKAWALGIGKDTSENLEEYCLRALDKRVKGLKFNLAHAHETLKCDAEGIKAHRVEGDIRMVFDIYSKLTNNV